MISRIFIDHPRSVGETYTEHAATAGRFGLKMVVAGAACVVHAALPFIFARTASDTVKQLYGEMKARQPNFSNTPPAFQQPEWQIEYEI